MQLRQEGKEGGERRGREKKEGKCRDWVKEKAGQRRDKEAWW